MPAIGRLFSINTRVDGVVSSIEVKPGDGIKKGELVAKISDHEYDQKLARTEKNVASLTSDLANLKDQIDKEGAAQMNYFHKQLKSSEFSLKQINKRIKEIIADLKLKKGLLKKGLIALSSVTEAEDKLSSAEVESEVTKTAIAQIRFNLIKGYRTDDIQAEEKELAEAIKNRDLLKLQKHYYTVLSPWDGDVLELKVAAGEIVSRGQNLILTEREDKKGSHNQVFAYFPIEQGKRLMVGQAATIAVSTVNTRQYGVIAGKVASVSKYAVSNKSLDKMYFNDELVNYLTDGKTVIEAVIDPEINLERKEYKWSKGKNPPVSITTGTVCLVKIDLSSDLSDDRPSD
jgi:multidrug resistance efflux pump